MKLCLGTAQFGLDYGINNTRGKIPGEEVIAILNLAYDSNITMIDTASAYGNSETVLGEGIAHTGKNFKIITKYPANTELRPLQWIDASLGQLKTEKVYGCLFHNYSTFQDHPNYIEDFIEIKKSGKVAKIGFSLYHPFEAEYILKNNVPCDIVQIPYNIFDQRFAFVFPMLKSKNIEIHVRSIFLQGLFFIPLDKIDVNFLSVKDNLTKFHDFASKTNLDISTLCFGFVNQNTYIDKIVIGIDSLDNLVSNVNSFEKVNEIKVDCSFLEELSVTDEKIILPFNWKQKLV